MPPMENLTDVGAMSTSPQMVNFWVRALLSVKNLDKKLWYMACNNCNKGTDVEYDEPFRCLFCKEESVAAPRCRFEVELCDETGSLLATVFGNTVENFLNCTSKTLMLATTEDGIPDLENIAMLLCGAKNQGDTWHTINL